jgi:hypothetical protein
VNQQREKVNWSNDQIEKGERETMTCTFFLFFSQKKYFSEIDHVLENGVNVTFDEKQWFSTFFGGPKILIVKQQNVFVV